jgi:hypothetical protein
MAFGITLQIVGILTSWGKIIGEATRGNLVAYGDVSAGQDANKCGGGPTIEAWGR